MYHDQDSQFDCYPEGDPLGQNLQDIIKALQWQKIRLQIYRFKKETFLALKNIKQFYDSKKSIAEY